MFFIPPFELLFFKSKYFQLLKPLPRLMLRRIITNGFIIWFQKYNASFIILLLLFH